MGAGSERDKMPCVRVCAVRTEESLVENYT